MIKYDKRIPFTFKYPNPNEVFKALKIPYVKVVILGEHATIGCKGYAYYSDNPTEELKELTKNIDPSFKNIIDGNLDYWIEQGIMLLNWHLTYPKNDYWDEFMPGIIKQIEEIYPKAIFVLPNKKVKVYKKYITNKVVYDLESLNPKIEKLYTFSNNKYATLLSFLKPNIIWNKEQYDFQKSSIYYLIAFVDGSFRKNTGKASWGTFLPGQLFGLRNSIIGHAEGLLPEKSTIIDAEGIALFKTFNIFAYATKYFPYTFKVICITDNEFWYKTLLGEYNTTQKADLYKKIMKQIIFDIELIWVPSHNKPVKSLEDYRYFNKGNLTDTEIKELIIELKDGNDVVDKTVTSLTL